LFCAYTKEGGTGPDGEYYAPGSIVVWNEIDDATDDYMGTLNWPISATCNEITDVCSEFRMRPKGYIDPQVAQDHGAPTRLLDEYQANGVHVQRWKRHRRDEKAALVRELLAHAAPPGRRDKAGLYFCRRCTACINTIPTLPTDPKRRTDVKTAGTPDHWYDALAGAVYRGGEYVHVQHVPM
jgi:hypothetical protein